jgi:hypothetical protein
VLAVR